MEKEKYSNKTKEKVRSILLKHISSLNNILLEMDKINVDEHKKIMNSMVDRDLVLIDKLGFGETKK